MKKCPYCGKRISYFAKYSSRRKGEYVCRRCRRESKVTISKFIYLGYALAASAALAILACIYFMKMINNPFSIALVAIPLILFLLISPAFVRFEPYKKYRKSMEARRAGIAYSDKKEVENIITEPEQEPVTENTAEESGFSINADIFNKIKAERNAARNAEPFTVTSSVNDMIVITDDDTEEIAEIETTVNKTVDEEYIPIINDVSTNSSTNDTPLRKLHSDNSRGISRTRHYIGSTAEKPAHMKEESTEDLEKDKSKKYKGNRFSANRRF